MNRDSYLGRFRRYLVGGSNFGAMVQGAAQAAIAAARRADAEGVLAAQAVAEIVRARQFYGRSHARSGFKQNQRKERAKSRRRQMLRLHPRCAA